MAWIKHNDTGEVVEVSESTAGQMVLNGYAERSDSPQSLAAQKAAETRKQNKANEEDK